MTPEQLFGGYGRINKRARRIGQALCVALAVAYGGVAWAFHYRTVSGAARVWLGLLPSAVEVALVGAIAWFVGSSGDEMMLKLQMQAATLALWAMFVLGVVLDGLKRAGLYHGASGFDGVVVVLWLIGLVVFSRRMR